MERQPIAVNPGIEPETDAVTAEMRDMYLNFCVDEETYSIEIRFVQQIVGMQEINRMPEMQYYMKGFINLRGSIIPVVSMRLRFGKPDMDYTDRTCIVVTEVAGREIGLIVDAIRETLTIEPQDIAAPPHSEERGGGYITGIAKLKDQKTSVVINLQALLGGETF